jgi:ATP-dependent RNA helicase RhlE
MFKSNSNNRRFSNRNASFDSRFSRTRRPNNGGHFGGGRNSKRRSFSESIDISKFINRSDGPTEANQPVITHAFNDFNLCQMLKTNLQKKNYLTPTPIQDQSIDHILAGRDLIGLANTGTGKTAAFLLPLIDKVSKNRSERVLIIAPTRELAQQIDNEFRQFSWGMQIFSAVCVGGTPIFKQIHNLKRNPNFIIGTPGRLKDLGDRGLIKFDRIGNIVLDEVDRMLDMGFVDEIREMLAKLSQTRQSLFFSATIPPKINDLIGQFMTNPIRIEVKIGSTADVDQDVVRVDKERKFDQLAEILGKPETQKVLIFTETKREVDKLTNSLISGGFKAESIHGDKRQSQRMRSLDSFRTNRVNILVATDVAARGLDIKNVTHVINYTVPQTYNDYIHRIGRTGRAGQAGKALTFVG